MGAAVKKKIGRPAKYRNEAERKEAARQRSREARARNKERKVGWAAKISSKLSAVEDSQEELGGFADLPPVNVAVPPEQPNGDTPPDGVDVPPANDNAPPAEAPAEESKDEAKADTKNVSGEEMAEMGAALWVGMLQAGTKYANEAGFPGIDEPFFTMNHQAAKILLREALKESSMKPEEFAALVCGGSGAWVGWNAFRAYKSKQPVKKTNAGASAPKEVIDAQFSSPPPIVGQNTNGVAQSATGATAPGAGPVAGSASARGEYT